MEIKTNDLKPAKIKTKLLVIAKKGEKAKIDIIKENNFSAERVIEITLKDFELENLRNLGARTVRAAAEYNVDDIAIVLPETGNNHETSQAITEGALLGSYKFIKFKTKNEGIEIKQLIIVSEHAEAVQKGITHGKLISEYVYLARDFVNDPANHQTPESFAKKIAEISKKNKLKVHIYEKSDLEKLGMGCLLGVAMGSNKDPRLVVIEYKPKSSKEFYAIVGKGITFDSGGLSLKPEESMYDMKGDMAGGAAVACAINAIAKLKLPVNITAVIPCVENMPGGNAMKPGDVLLSMSGKTVEVLSTDAEGRLILADALHFIAEQKPKAIIDLATLTGSCVVALGNNVAGLMGTDDKLAENIFNAGEKTSERVWRMPVYQEYTDAIKSEIADIKNMGDDRAAGSLTAAAFLKEFIDKTPWVHIDMAGTFWSKENKDYKQKGPTGWGVRLLVELFSNL